MPRFLLFLASTLLLSSVLVQAASSDDKEKGIPPLSQMGVYDVLGILFMALGLVVSSAGGVGGGAIMVPSMVLIMGFDIKLATPISNMAILGGAIANAMFNLSKRHPYVDRPLVDSDISLAMIPVVMGGAIIGALFSKLLPSYAISLLFVLVLFASGGRTLLKGVRLYKAEAAAKKAREEALAIEGTGGPSSNSYASLDSPRDEFNDNPLVNTSKGVRLAPTTAQTPVRKALDTITAARTSRVQRGSASSSQYVANDKQELQEEGSTSSEDPTTDSNDTLQQILDRERSLSWGKQGVIFVCYLGIVAASIANKAVDCGSPAYWVILLANIPWVAIFAVGIAFFLLKSHTRKQSAGYHFAEGDVQWNRATVTWFPLGCGIAGIVAGLFGVGGAIVTSPMLIEIGVIPEVTAATTALMVLYSSAAATAKYAVFDMIAWDWASLLCGVAFVVTAASQVVILGYVRRSGRQSVVVLCIGLSIVSGALLMTYQAVSTTISHVHDRFVIDFCS
ncbi:hypothetical protein Poli38472_009055 [Pythium oligandrum]|uniref:Sulfite exporter TauE/SafE n=1 Tax=Pythium oligandrum TaxID=41045 RepID=A0A8K1FNR3_PYTOL|nr:hypothetical protein Poli38472_009055 [Pythium oligandrum]|eukprot:TMW64888.1 hypothetical protein Poli38472_009055 [Pythium oligandrum]